jgi:hypothetical protein
MPTHYSRLTLLAVAVLATLCASPTPARGQDDYESYNRRPRATISREAYYDRAEEEVAPRPAGGVLSDKAFDFNNGDDGDADLTPIPCDTCGDPCGSCRCCQCGPPGQFWLRQEYVGWFAKAGHVPTLVTTSPDGSLPALTPLYGNGNYNGNFRSGLWTQGGMWFDCCKNCGIQGDYLFVGRQSSPFAASSNGDPVLARPFTDANTGALTQELVSFPNVVVGNINVSNYNSLGGAGGAFRKNLCCWQGCCDPCGDCCNPCFQDCCRVDFLAGFRYFQFNDNIGIRENLTSIDQTSGVAVGTQFAVNDSFRTLNTFYGAEFGLIADRYRGRWMYEGAARVALGNTHQIVSINGNTAISFPGQPTASYQGGLLALASNIGRYTHNDLAAIPMLSGRIGYRVTPRFTLLAGYTFIYWGQVARAGDQIDTTVNPNLIPPAQGGGPNRPAFELHTSNLWLQGITLGGEIYF